MGILGAETSEKRRAIDLVWLVSVGAVTVVVVMYWVMLDVVLDSFGPRPPGEWPPPTRDGSPA